MPTSALWIVGGAIVIVWVAVRQLRTRRVKMRPGVGLLVVRWALLAYGVGLVAMVIASQHRPVPLVVAALLAALGVLAVGLGVWRGAATRVWADPHDAAAVLRRGGLVVIALWALSFGVHLVLDGMLDAFGHPLHGVGPTTMLAYLVITLAAQNTVVRRRAAAVVGSSGIGRSAPVSR